MYAYNLLDHIIDNHGSGASVVSQQHDLGGINWVAGLSDPGEMIACGYLPEIRRRAGEQDTEYAERIRPIVMALPQEQQDMIMGAAIKRAALDTTGGKVRVMTAGQLPWHGLGVNIDKACTSAEAIRFAGLDWAVSKEQLTYTFDGKTLDADAWGIIRQDTGDFLGAVGSRYAPIQNVDGFAFLDGVLEQFGARYETAGSVYGGKKVWMLAHLPKQAFTINGGDEVEPYVLFENCHDGTGAANCYPTAVRVVCANTLRVSTTDRHKGMSIRHTGSVKGKISAAQDALGMSVHGFEEFKTQAETLYHKPMEIRHYAHDVLDAVLDITQAQAMMGADALAASLKVTEAQRELERKSFQRQIERRGEVLADILERYESERCGIGSIRGTAWAAFNAVTEHADHNTLGKQAKDQETRLSRRFESTISGQADEMKQTALQIALKA